MSGLFFKLGHLSCRIGNKLEAVVDIAIRGYMRFRGFRGGFKNLYILDSVVQIPLHQLRAEITAALWIIPRGLQRLH